MPKVSDDYPIRRNYIRVRVTDSEKDSLCRMAAENETVSSYIRRILFQEKKER